MAENPNDFALVVGIEHYPNHAPLKGPIADATWFRDWLMTPLGGGLDPEAPNRCELIVSREEPVRPMHEDIDDALLRILDEARALEKAGERARRFYFFFSGHGLANRHSQTNLCLAKWSKPRRNMALSHQDYQQLLIGWGTFSEIVMVLDCCRVPMHGVRGLPSTIGLAAARPGARRSRLFTAHATSFLDPADERPEADDPDLAEFVEETQVRGNLTQALREGLSGAISAPTGGVTANALKAYLTNNVPRIAKANNNRDQRPEVDNGLEADEFGREPVFGAAPPSGKVEVRIDWDDARRGHGMTLEGPRLEVIERRAAGDPWVVRLEPGVRYMLIDADSKERRELKVPPGKDVQHVRF